MVRDRRVSRTFHPIGALVVTDYSHYIEIGVSTDTKVYRIKYIMSN